MKFHEHTKHRLEVRKKKYGKDSWKILSPDELIQMIQEELVDVVNYIGWLRVKGVNMTHHNFHLESLYKALENRRKKK